MTATATILSLFAPTSIRSTSIRVVSKVVVVPSTVKLPVTFTFWKVPIPVTFKFATCASPKTSNSSSGSSVPIPTRPLDFTVILFSLFVPIVKSSPSEVPIAKSSPSL